MHKQIPVATDNTTVVAYINKEGGTRSSTLLTKIVLLLEWAQGFCMNLRARHNPGRLNVVADALSRNHQVVQTEWRLHKEIVQQIFELWAPRR